MSEVDSFTFVTAASVSIVGSDYIQQVGGPTTSTVKGSIELISWGCDECRWVKGELDDLKSCISGNSQVPLG